MCCTFADVNKMIGAILVGAALWACAATPAPTASEPQAAAEEALATDPGPLPGDPAPVPEETPPPPPPPPGELVKITVLAAEIQGRMANDEHWDSAQGNSQTPQAQVPKPLLRYLLGHPELSKYTATIGIPVDDPELLKRAQNSPAADPMVLVEFEGSVYRSPVQPRSFTPLWDFAFQILYGEIGTRRGIPPGSLVRIHVVDYDSPITFDPIGTTVMSIEDLINQPLHELGPFGGVGKLTLEVRKLAKPNTEDAAISKRLAIPGTASWTDTGIRLTAGQRVIINAADEICTKGDSLENCCGPEGLSRLSSYNQEGFAGLGHGALIAAIGDTRFAIQRGQNFIAPASAQLRLGINDTNTDDNSGSYAVHIVVNDVP